MKLKPKTKLRVPPTSSFQYFRVKLATPPLKIAYFDRYNRYTQTAVQNPRRGLERANAFVQKHLPRLPRVQSTPARSEVFIGPLLKSNMYFESYSDAAAAASRASIDTSHEVILTRFFSRFPRAVSRFPVFWTPLRVVEFAAYATSTTRSLRSRAFRGGRRVRLRRFDYFILPGASRRRPLRVVGAMGAHVAGELESRESS